MHNILISVIIPVYNGQSTLHRAVKSLFDTNYPNLEIIIVDDGSIDSSLEIAHRLREKYPSVVKVYSHERNLNKGVSATRNLGLRSAKGELVAFLDADDYVLKNRFCDVYRFEDESIGAVYTLTKMEFVSKNDDLTFFTNHYFGLGFFVEEDKVLTHLLRSTVWATSGILFRRELLKKIGYFNEDMRCSEDCNLWLKLAATTRVIAGNMDEALSVYVRHEMNSYKPSPMRSIDFLDAVIDAWQQVGRKYHDGLFKEGILNYLRKILASKKPEERLIDRALLKCLSKRKVRFVYLHPFVVKWRLGLLAKGVS